MEMGWILLPDTSPTLETFRKRPRRVPMVFPSPKSTRDGQPWEPLNVIDPHCEVFDEGLYRLLVEHPAPQRPLPEHVLIMAGLSRNWPHIDAESILKDGDEGMLLLGSC
ncbi:hypothetical protein Hanom_Chr16g01494711 [Helianthus anomalus]